MRTILWCLILGILVVSALVVLRDDPSEPDPPTTAVHVIDPRGDVEWMAPTTTTTTTTAPSTTTTTQPRARTAPTGRCGGDLPPCSVMMTESGGDIHAYNPHGCSGRGCYGKWQCDPNTCDGTGTEAEQDAEARRVWNNGEGCEHWAAC